MTFQRIVVGTDGSETADRAVGQAARLAQLDGAELVVASAYGPATTVDQPEAAARVEAGAAIARQIGVAEPATETLEGSPAEVLVAVATTRDADLLVVGSKGMTDTSRFVLGSVANHVSHHAACDVLIARTADGALDFRPGPGSGNIVS